MNYIGAKVELREPKNYVSISTRASIHNGCPTISFGSIHVNQSADLLQLHAPVYSVAHVLTSYYHKE